MAITVYERDNATGVVSVNCGAEVELLAPTRPAEDSPQLSDWVKARNHRGRVCISGHRVAYQVAVITKGKTFIIDSGITNAPVANTVTPISVKVRQEEPVAEPQNPSLGEIG